MVGEMVEVVLVTSVSVTRWWTGQIDPPPQCLGGKSSSSRAGDPWSNLVFPARLCRRRVMPVT